MLYTMVGQIELHGWWFKAMRDYNFNMVHLPDEIRLNTCIPERGRTERWVIEGLARDIIKDYKRAVMKKC